ncbi:dienelactone hydrolase family protein [Caldicellulosiruptor sp. DIB 104C]|uniref:dienelactone hydrolase family protein n=1 Tax=Caldicellulosiruptor sp. DIB 104C TaxID=3019889 RepID=UPI002306B1EA|nr:dienelactone hydrolase family protein [Caldicellulosiruptor sp. DIB 104C]
MVELFERYFGIHNKPNVSAPHWAKSILDSCDFEFQKSIVEKLQPLLYLNLELCFVERNKREIHYEAFTEELITANLNGIESEAAFLKPSNSNPPYPVIVVLHDHGGFYYYGKERIFMDDSTQPFLREYREKFYSSSMWAFDLLERGFAVFCPDAFYFGKRRFPQELIKIFVDNKTYEQLTSLAEGSYEFIKLFNRISSELEGIIFKNINFYGTNWSSILINEDIAWLNYLLKREDVDKERIACMGFSLGGFRTLFLSALKKEIKASLVIAFMSEFSKMLGQTSRHTFMVHIPSFTRFLDLPDIAGLILPRKLFVKQCSEDSLFPVDAMKSAVAKIEEYYSRAGCRHNFSYKFYPNPHQFNSYMQKDAFDYLFLNIQK